MPHRSPTAPPLSAEAYARCFLTFRQHSTEWLGMLAWCEQRLAGLLPPRPRLSALSVGAGNGDFDWLLLPMLRDRAPDLSWVFVEPSRAMCGHLRERMAREPMEGVAFELDHACFEDCARQDAFDLVLLTHCLYYIPDRAAAIQHALDLAGESGWVLIFHQTLLGIDQVQKRFIQRIKGSEQEMLTSQDLRDILERLGLPYRQEQIQSHIDVSECIRPDSEQGEALLSFFLECDVRDIDAGLKQEVREYLRELSQPDQGRMLLRHPVDVIMLSRQIG